MKSETTGLVAGTVAAAIIVLCGGCFTPPGVAKYDRIATQRAIQLSAQPGGAMLGVDLLALNTGTFAAFATAPVEMSVRVLGDAVLAAGTAYAGYLAIDSLQGGSSKRDTSATAGGHSVQVSGENNIVTVGDRTDNSVAGGE